MFRFLIPLLFIFLAEYFSFVVLKTVLRSVNNPLRNILLLSMMVLSLCCWAAFGAIRHSEYLETHKTLRVYFIAFLFGFTIAKLLITVVMLSDEIRRLLLWIWYKISPKVINETTAAAGSGISRSVFLARLAAGLGLFSVFGFLNGTRNRYNYKIKKIPLHFPNLPEAFRGLKILQLSDIHTGSFDSKKEVARGIQMAMQQKPDLILFTGDLVNDRALEAYDYAPIYAQLKAPMGVFSVLGNHDYGDYWDWESEEAKAKNLEDLKKFQSHLGWKLLMNEHVVFEKNGQKIALIGVENWSDKARFPKHGKMKEAYAGLPEKNIPFQILMSHDPSHWDAQVRPGYPKIDLTLSGHTHGMQFGVEIPGLKWSPARLIYKQWAGLYTEGRQKLYVNRGYGYLGYPGRIGILPEITVFELS